MTFTTIASGSSGNAYLLESEGASLLIEAGLPFKALRQALWGLDRNLSSISGCLISHAHGDHSASAKALDGWGIDVYVSDYCAQKLGVTGLWAFTRKIGSLEHFCVGPFLAMGFAMKHDDSGDSMGFVVDGPCGGRLCYISDARFTEWLVPAVTIFAVEANYDPEILRKLVAKGALESIVAERIIRSHMSIDTTIALLRANDLSRCEKIILLHLSDGNSDAAAFIRRVEAATGVPTEVAGWTKKQ